MKNGKIYIGTTLNANYIGVYNSKNKSLDEVWSINTKGHQIQIAPGNHPVFLQKKFEDTLIDISIKVDSFLYTTDPDKLKLGDEFIKIYKEAKTGLLLTNPDESLENKELADKLRKKIEKAENNSKSKLIIQN